MNQPINTHVLVRSWLLLLLLVPVSQVCAQVSYTVKHYTIRDGLAQGGAYNMIKDSRHYLWFMSQNGLTRFDGTRFVHYQSSKSDPASGPTGNTGSGLAEASNGDLWFGTEQGLNHYVRATNRFTSHFARDGQGHALPTLTHVIDVDSNQVWYINQAEGLLSLDWHTGQRVLQSGAIRHDSPYDNEYIKHRPETSEIWLLLPDDGVLCFNYRTGKTRSFFSHRQDNKRGRPRPFSALYLAPDQTVWLTYTDVLVALDPNSGQSRTYELPASPGSDVPTAIDADRQGNIWLATGNDGIYQFNKVQHTWTNTLRHNPFDPNSLATNAIAELLIDQEGIIWVNTDPTGLGQLIPDTHRVRHYDVNPLKNPSLSTHTVWGVAEDQKNNVWIGTYDAGIDVLNPKTEQIIHHYERTKKPGSLPANTIHALYTDKRGRIWVGAGSTLCRFDELTDSFIPVPLVWSDSSTGDKRIVSLLEVTEGQFFAATWSGLYEFNAATNRMSLLADVNTWFSRTLHYDPRTHYLYAGRHLRDFVCYELKDGAYRVRYTALPTLNVQNITPDTDPDRLWVSTNDGLYLLRAADGIVLRSWHEQAGLPDRVVYSALADQTGLRWLSTNRGMAVLNPRNGQIRQAQNFEPAEFNNSAFLLARSGNMYFGSTTGLYRFDPLRQTPRRHALSVNFTALLVNDQRYRADSNFTELRHIVLKPDQRTLTIEFGAIDYFSGGQNQYRYRLAGYDQGWVESGPINTARYPNLPPGNYVFDVLGANSAGQWMTQPRRLAITVNPPFWRTPWFMTLAFLLMGGLAYTGSRAYLSGQLRRQKREFQLQTTSQLAERERLARDLHDNIGPDMVALKLQLEAASESVPAGPATSVLKQLISLSDRIVNDIRQVSHALMPTELQQRGLDDALQSFMRQIDNRQIGPEISYTYSIDTALPERLQQAFLQITKELVNNALKHAHATLIDVELYQKSHRTYLVVSDNGRGYTSAILTGGAAGIGLRNIRTTVNYLNGQLNVVEKPAGGMSHQVTIPMA